MRTEHIESMRQQVIRKMNDKKCFTYWRIDPVWQPISRKAQGVRMGSGKGGIKFYVFPVRSGRIILEVGGKVEFEEVRPFLQIVVDLLPFKSRIISRESLQESNERDKMLEKLNQNPFTFRYSAKNNMLGISKWLSPYDYLWYGKHR